MKKIYLFIGILFCGALVFGQNNMFIQGANTWNTTNTNWGSISGSSGKIWKNDSIANLELSPVISLSGFNPFVYGINCTSTGSVTPTVSERIYLAGNSSPAIDVSAGQTLTLNNIMAGGRGFSKTSAGTLIFRNANNRFLNFANGITINAGTIDFADSISIASSALRCMPVNLGGNTLQYSGVAVSPMRFGALSGAGTLSLGVANNGLGFLTNSASTSAIITGADFTIRGTGGTVQTFTGNTAGLSGVFAVQGVSTLDGAGGTSNGATFSGGGSNTLNNSTNRVSIRGGRFTVDNTTNNLTNRFPTAAATGLVTFLGGTFELLGNSAGTSFTIGSGYTAANKATTINAGQNNIIVNQPAGAAAPTVLTFGAGPTAASLRDQNRMTINFSSTGSGTLGASATDPQIRYSTAPIINAGAAFAPSNMFANTATGATVGFATVNNNDWATYGVNGVVARANDVTTATTAGLQAGTVTQAVLFNPGVAPAAASGNIVSSVIIFDPASAGLTLPMGSFTMAGIALMHRGANNFTITGTASILAGANTTRNIYVMNPLAVLSTNALLNSANPFNKSGDGTFALTGATNQVAFAGVQSINLCGGVLRGTAAALGGATSAGGPNSTINFYGGVLELDGGMSFSRALDINGAAGGGGIGFDLGSTQRGNGGFSAINGNSSVTLVTTTGGAIAANLQWNNDAWLSTGYSLLMGSKLSDSRITLTNNLVLDDSTATAIYTVREVYVYNNISSATDESELSGIISGGPNSDFLKGGPGSLRLSNNANTYNGNTIVAQGTLVAVATGSLSATTSALIKTGATLQLLANNTITDLVLESGSTLDLGTNTLTLTGNFTNNGGTVLGTGTIVFNGTSQQYIDGVAVTLYNLTINNAAGMHMLTSVTINNVLTFTSGIIYTTTANLLTLTATASVTVPSNASFVNGPVSKIGNTDFIFPVGNPNCGPTSTVNGYVPIGISNFSGGTLSDQYTAEYIRASGAALPGGITAIGLVRVSSCEYWKLDKVSGTVPVDVRLYWDSAINNCTTSSPYINNLPGLVVAHHNGASWDTYGATLTATGTVASGDVTWPGVTVFSPFTIGSVSFTNPLSITVNYLNGTKNNGNHLLNWKVTCNTSPRVTLVLERSASNRTGFTAINTVDASAARCATPFNYTDASPLQGMNYYRLKMIDADGKVTYSNVIAILNATKGFEVLNIAPNPVTSNGTFKLNITSAKAEKLQTIITDMQGRILATETITTAAGYNTIDMNVAKLAAGTYSLYTTNNGEKSKVIRFVKQ